jgi:5'-methylthioadenosine phosphorylase
MSIIGMTTSPEAFLAREAEICYSVMAHVTDYDVWHSSELPVTVEMVIKVLLENTSEAQKIVRNLIPTINPLPECGCSSAMKNALITNKNFIPPETREKLDVLIGKHIQ